MVSTQNNSSIDGNRRQGVSELEVRPGGMFVQIRDLNPNPNPSPPTIELKVKFGSSYHHLHISSHASFGNIISLFASIQFPSFSFFGCEYDSEFFITYQIKSFELGSYRYHFLESNVH